jgi:predicted extracellular nuclease
VEHSPPGRDRATRERDGHNDIRGLEKGSMTTCTPSVRLSVAIAAVVVAFTAAAPASAQTVDPCSAADVAIGAVQGTGASVALTGTRTVQGVVVADYEGASPALRGFYLQDAGDGNPATSDGIFVFNGANSNLVNVGDVVQVTGTAGENQGQSQISVGPTGVVKCGSTGTVTPTNVTMPFPSADFLERYEGMLVRFPQTLYVTETFQLGRFGQVVLSSGDRLRQPTEVALPGAPANALQAANALNQLILDDDNQTQNPDPIAFGRGGQPLSAANTLRGGDTATGIVGVMTFTWAGNSASPNAYRLRPLGALNGSVQFQPTNPRPSAPPAVGGTTRVASFNVLNWFNTFADGNAATPGCYPRGVDGDCRGANSQAEFDRQSAKTVAALAKLDGHVVGLIELENDGYDAASSIADLVGKLNAATAPGRYAFLDVDARTGKTRALGTDGIRVGLIYQPAHVKPVGTTAVLDTVAFVNGGDAEPRNRVALMQAFETLATAERFSIVVNHLKSKGSACTALDANDGQGNCNAVRTAAAAQLAAWLQTDPTGTGDPDVLIVGDLNSYSLEDPVRLLKDAGYADLVREFAGGDAAGYVFSGQWGNLDHALATQSLASQVTGAGVYNVNSPEPTVLDYNREFKSAGQITSLYAPDEFRSADHDPVVVGLELDSTPPTLKLSATPTVLWPANHKLVEVRVTAVAKDAVDATPTVSLVSATSSEPDDALGDGDTAGDVVRVDDYTFMLRAERFGGGPGRTYTLTYRAADDYGNSTTAAVQIGVPANRGR